MQTDNYWSRARTPASRRRFLKGALAGGAGIAGLALIGCGGSDDKPSAATSSTTAPTTAGAQPAAATPEKITRGGKVAIGRDADLFKFGMDPHTGVSRDGLWRLVFDVLVADNAKGLVA